MESLYENIDIGIDASNLRKGGGLTNLAEFIEAAEPEKYGINRMVVWGGERTLRSLPSRSWLLPIHESILDGFLPKRLYWQYKELDKRVKESSCRVLLAAGSHYLGTFKPFLTISHTTLPFEPEETRRYRYSWRALKLMAIRFLQLNTFRKADGVIFLSNYAQAQITNAASRPIRKSTVLPIGVHDRFRLEPRNQKPISDYSINSPYRLLYVSHVSTYKHQWHVVKAGSMLREAGYPISLDFVGTIGNAGTIFHRSLDKYDPERTWAQFKGNVQYSDMHTIYHSCDMFIFASTCETMPNILLEAMASGLPIVSSDRGPMPEMLQDSGLYCDPEDASSIANAIRQFLEDPKLREQKAWSAHERAKSFSWKHYADLLLSYIKETIDQSRYLMSRQ